MRALRRYGGRPRQHPGNDHQTLRPNRSRMGGKRRRSPRVLSARPDYHRHPGRYQRFNACTALCVAQQRPLAHGTAVNNGPHPCLNEFHSLRRQRTEIRLAACRARRHQGRTATGENGLFSVHVHNGEPGSPRCRASDDDAHPSAKLSTSKHPRIALASFQNRVGFLSSSGAASARRTSSGFGRDRSVTSSDSAS